MSTRRPHASWLKYRCVWMHAYFMVSMLLQRLPGGGLQCASVSVSRCVCVTCPRLRWTRLTRYALSRLMRVWGRILTPPVPPPPPVSSADLEDMFERVIEAMECGWRKGRRRCESVKREIRRTKYKKHVQQRGEETFVPNLINHSLGPSGWENVFDKAYLMRGNSFKSRWRFTI